MAAEAKDTSVPLGTGEVVEVTGEASMVMVGVEVLMSSDRVMTRSAKVSESGQSQAVGGER